MKYRVDKGCQWRDFTLYGDAVGGVIDAADLKTGDGKPLPKEVVGQFVAKKCLVPCDDDGTPLETP